MQAKSQLLQRQGTPQVLQIPATPHILQTPSNSTISASTSSTVSSIISQGKTSEEAYTATVASVQKIISKLQGPIHSGLIIIF